MWPAGGGATGGWHGGLRSGAAGCGEEWDIWPAGPGLDGVREYDQGQASKQEWLQGWPPASPPDLAFAGHSGCHSDLLGHYGH